MTSNPSTYFRLAVMTTKSQEIERARKELELLKEKERSLAAKLASLNKTEDNQNAYTEHYLTNLIMDEPIPVKNGLTHQNIFQSILMNGDFQESNVDETSDTDEIKEKKETVPTVFTNSKKNIDTFPNEGENFQDQKITEDSFEEDEKLDDFQFSITNNSQLNFSHSEEELYLENEDLETKSTSPVDHRNDIFQDIYEAKAREKALRIERGTFVESDQSSSETESEKETQIEDSRDRIVREIEEEKLRELELQAKYKGRGILLNRTLEEPEKTQLKENIETRQLISIEINDFKQREEELRTQWSKLNRTKKKKEDDDFFINSMQLEPRHYVENGIYEEKIIMQELIKLENLLHNKSSENEEIEEKENNSKGKIFQEIKELLYRELELKERSQGIQKKQVELQAKQKHEAEQQKQNQERQKINIEGQINNKIWQEIVELQRREENLKREFAKIQHKKLQMNNMLNGIPLLHLNDSEMRSLDVEKFNTNEKALIADRMKVKNDKVNLKKQPVRDKDVKVNPSNMDKEDQTSQLVKKPIVQVNQFGRLKDVQGKQPSEVKDGYSNKPSRAKDIQVNKISSHKLLNFEEKKKKKIILGQNSEISNNLVSQDVKLEDNIQQNEKSYTHDLSILPITTKWENKAEEERHKQLAIQREIQSKRDNKIQIMRIKAEQERLRQEEQRILDLEKQRVIKNRYLLKLKQQGLNDLWAAKKPLVTLEYNEDRNDLHLLDNTFMQIKINNPALLTLPTAASTPPTTTSTPTTSTPTITTPITLTKTIMKWEKRIKKNTSKNMNFT
ncbi:golgin subfamily A member 6-like protein 22 [Hydra vulgaris]|uniref:golgin subfamily A member 6-like protein 22 n=1 Tax=Hydra vulgaris TaxID=6087 RepID=UPI001F5EC2D4|nr:golgin subfamily A member 6-like protein 22 [Hydra vulgaris]